MGYKHGWVNEKRRERVLNLVARNFRFFPTKNGNQHLFPLRKNGNFLCPLPNLVSYCWTSKVRSFYVILLPQNKGKRKQEKKSK